MSEKSWECIQIERNNVVQKKNIRNYRCQFGERFKNKAVQGSKDATSHIAVAS
jgi:hypothetical protein